MRRLPGRTRRRLRTAVFAVWVSLFAVACTTISPERPQPPELRKLRVAVTEAVDTIPLRIAVEQGLFQRAGLKIEFVEQGGQREALAELMSGRVDVAWAGNLTLLTAASEDVRIQLQGEAYISGPDTMALITLPDGGYEEPTDRPAPVIAVEPHDELGKLATRSRLETEGVAPDKITFTPLGYAGMIDALRDGRADAAWMIEPHISQAQKEHGAQILTDTARGALLDFPMSSYAAMTDRAQAHPRTFALFRKLLSKAQQLADDPSVVRAELGRLTTLDKTTATLVAVGSFPTSLSNVRLQRVADLMHRSGLVPARVDVNTLIPAAAES